MNRSQWWRTILIRWVIVAIAVTTGCSACGGGGGGGGGSGEIEVLDEVTFLLNDGGLEPRTGQKIQFILSDLSDPDVPLTDADVEVRRNGSVDVEARVRVNPPDVEKSDITLVLDVSSSLSPVDLQAVKDSAKEFADDILPLASTLRIYYFSSPSQTQLIDEFEAVAIGGSINWSPNPAPAIDAIPGGVNSTALFNAVRLALLGDVEGDDILVVFSDGQENSSPQGAREEALELIEQNRVVVFSVGFGSVDSDDLRALSEPFGAFLGVRPSLVGIFREVARLIQSVYAVVYDTPVSFGTQTVDFRFDVGKKTLRHESVFDAGVDLARSVFGRYPTMPGSIVQLTDMSVDPPESIGFKVLPVEEAVAGLDGLFAFAIQPLHLCPGPSCVLSYQGPYGEGARSESGGEYFPVEFDVGKTWTDPVSGGEFMFTGFEDIEFFRGTSDRRRIECARVTFDGGTHWFARDIGLVRTRNDEGDLLLEMTTPPCLSDSFDGGCTIE